MNYYYTKQEKSLIKRLYPITNTNKLAKQLGVSSKALNARALKWGLVKVTKWLPEQILFLKNNYQKMSATEIAEELKRSVSSVSSKAEKLGLYFNKWTKEETSHLKKVYRTGGSKAFREKFPDKSISTISAKARAEGLLRVHWTRKELSFLKANFNKMSSNLLAQKLNKTQASIEHKASRLNLVNAPNFGHLETIVEDHLLKSNISFTKQHSVKPFRIDFVINGNIAIEVNGTYWHADKRQYTTLDKTQAYVVDKDKRKYKMLRSKGYRLIILWEKDINQDFSKIANGINAVVSGDINEYNSAKSVKA